MAVSAHPATSSEPRRSDRLDKERRQVQTAEDCITRMEVLYRNLEKMFELIEELPLLKDESEECLTQQNEACLEEEVGNESEFLLWHIFLFIIGTALSEWKCQLLSNSSSCHREISGYLASHRSLDRGFEDLYHLQHVQCKAKGISKFISPEVNKKQGFQLTSAGHLQLQKFCDKMTSSPHCVGTTLDFNKAWVSLWTELGQTNFISVIKYESSLTCLFKFQGDCSIWCWIFKYCVSLKWYFWGRCTIDMVFCRFLPLPILHISDEPWGLITEFQDGLYHIVTRWPRSHINAVYCNCENLVLLVTFVL